MNSNATATGAAVAPQQNGAMPQNNDNEVLVYSITKREGIGVNPWLFGPRKQVPAKPGEGAELIPLQPGEALHYGEDGALLTGIVDIPNIDPRRNQARLRTFILDSAAQLTQAGWSTRIYTNVSRKPDGRVFTTSTLRAFRNDGAGVGLSQTQPNALIAANLASGTSDDDGIPV